MHLNAARVRKGGSYCIQRSDDDDLIVSGFTSELGEG